MVLCCTFVIRQVGQQFRKKNYGLLPLVKIKHIYIHFCAQILAERSKVNNNFIEKTLSHVLFRGVEYNNILQQRVIFCGGRIHIKIRIG